MQPIVVFILIAVVFGVVAWFGHAAEVKRREALARLAAELGLQFEPDRNRDLPGAYGFLDTFGQGSNRYVQNRLTGVFGDQPVQAFDYHYETHSTDSKGRRRTHHHHNAFFILTLPRAFPELKIGPEGVFSKLAQAFGFDDIDFESHEFSRRFCVRSKDKRFAYDVCNARMMEYLLEQGAITIEIENDVLAVRDSGTLSPDRVRPGLERLVALRSLMPEYLFAKGGAA